MSSTSFRAALLAVLLIVLSFVSVACAQEAPQPAVPEHGTAQDQAEDVQSWSFNEDEIGKVPKGWTAAETVGAGTSAKWGVVSDSTAPEGPNVVAVQETKNTGQTYNLLIADEPSPKDLIVSVKVKAVEGEEDRGGGPMWRVRDADNYYIARWNPLEDNFRVYVVHNGKRKMLAGVEAKADPQAWHEIRIEMIGNRILATLDDKHFVETEDGTITEPGRIGLWTKADAATAFDEVRVRAPEPGE